MFPNAEIAVMGGEQASGVLVTLRNDQLAREGKPPLTQQEADEICRPIIEATKKESNALYSTSQLWDDGVLDPVDTRDVLGLAISASLNAPIPDDVFGYGIFRM
jgi:acetyl-CoA carboxylase carboxyltransferase component